MKQAAVVSVSWTTAAACFCPSQGSKAAQKPGPYPPLGKGGPGDTRQLVKSSATGSEELNGREPTQAFAGAIVKKGLYMI